MVVLDLEMENRLRFISSVILCSAFVITFYFDVTLGARMYLVGNLLALPYMVKNKCWDIVLMLVFFIIVGIPQAL